MKEEGNEGTARRDDGSGSKGQLLYPVITKYQNNHILEMRERGNEGTKEQPTVMTSLDAQGNNQLYDLLLTLSRRPSRELVNKRPEQLYTAIERTRKEVNEEGAAARSDNVTGRAGQQPALYFDVDYQWTCEARIALFNNHSTPEQSSIESEGTRE